MEKLYFFYLGINIIGKTIILISIHKHTYYIYKLLEKDNSRLTQDNLVAQNKVRDLEAQIWVGWEILIPNLKKKP